MLFHIRTTLKILENRKIWFSNTIPLAKPMLYPTKKLSVDKWWGFKGLIWKLINFPSKYFWEHDFKIEQNLPRLIRAQNYWKCRPVMKSSSNEHLSTKQCRGILHLRGNPCIKMAHCLPWKCKMFISGAFLTIQIRNAVKVTHIPAILVFRN